MTILSYSVSSGTRDGDSSSATSSKLDTDNYMWMFFSNVGIYQGAPITGATLTLRVDGTPKSSSSASHSFACVKSVAPSVPTTSTVKTAQRTSASKTVVFTPNNYSDNGAFTVDMTAVVQELVNQSGWLSGCNIAVVTTPVSTSTNLTFAAYEQGGSYAPAKLDIDYVANRPPVSDAGPDQTTGIHTGDTVYLDGTGSYDPDAGDTLTYAWTVVDAGGTDLTNADITNANSATASFIAPLPGSGL